MLPNFLILGTPKAGTTAIYNYINQHPQIFLPSFKEPHFFSFEGENKPNWAVSNIDDYQTLFNNVTTETAVGEASTWYLYSKTAPEIIHYHVPQAKLIAILRNPVDRAYSSWSFNVQCGWEDTNDFQKAIELEASRINQSREWDLHYLNTGLYHNQVKRYFNLFDRHRIKIYIYEKFKNNPLEVLQDIFKFLEVDEDFVPDISARHNTTNIPKNRLLNIFLTRQSWIKTTIKFLTPDVLRQHTSSKLRKANMTTRPQLSSLERQKLTDWYRQDIIKLQDLIDEDLSCWL